MNNPMDYYRELEEEEEIYSRLNDKLGELPVVGEAQDFNRDKINLEDAKTVVDILEGKTEKYNEKEIALKISYFRENYGRIPGTDEAFIQYWDPSEQSLDRSGIMEDAELIKSKLRAEQEEISEKAVT